MLRPNEAVLRAGEYAPANWEERMVRVPVTTANKIDNSLTPRALVVGISLNGAARAYPFDALLKQSPILDDVGGVPIVIVVGDDKKSVRAYARSIDGRRLEFFVKQQTLPLRLIDAETGSEWDFTGTAVSGPLTGKHLHKIAVLNDYWFDWKGYNSNTSVYDLGSR